MMAMSSLLVCLFTTTIINGQTIPNREEIEKILQATEVDLNSVDRNIKLHIQTADTHDALKYHDPRNQDGGIFLTNFIGVEVDAGISTTKFNNGQLNKMMNQTRIYDQHRDGSVATEIDLARETRNGTYVPSQQVFIKVPLSSHKYQIGFNFSTGIFCTDSTCDLEIKYQLYSNDKAKSVPHVHVHAQDDQGFNYNSLYADIPGATVFEIKYAYEYDGKWTTIDDVPMWIRKQLKQNPSQTGQKVEQHAQSSGSQPNNQILINTFVLAATMFYFWIN